MYSCSTNPVDTASALPARGWRRWINYDEQIWLIYIGFWFLQPYYDHAGLRQWLELIAASVFFTALYVLAHRGPARFKWFWILAMMVMGVAYVPFNQGACGIFIYVAASLPKLSESTNVVIGLLATEFVIVIIECFVFRFPTWVWSVGAVLSLVIGMNALRRTQKHRADAKLRMAHEEIERLAKTAERERIARDMHDVLGHSLSLIVLKSELAGRLLANQPARAALEVAEIESTARKALTEVRRTISGYRSEGFASEITRAAQVLEAAGVRLKSPEKPPMLTPRHEATLSMVLREAVTNIVRHARASECSIELSSAEETTQMVIADNGRGDIREEGNGLRGMRERIHELGGRLSVESAHGTRLQIELPQPGAEAHPVEP